VHAALVRGARMRQTDGDEGASGVKRMAVTLLGLVLLGGAPAAWADDAATCQAKGGSFLTGSVVQGPIFARGHDRDGVELSHTHVTLQADQDGKDYDVAMDNVFAAGYDVAGESVPAPLSSIAVGDRLELCGTLYNSGGVGIHFVHIDCGETPSQRDPDGWVKVLDANGLPGPNLENSQEYCKLFP
jgi:hypothetical protein